jgi:hypothetical protein
MGLAASGQDETPQTRPDPIAKSNGKRDATFYFAEAKRQYVELPAEISYDEFRELQLLWPLELTQRQRLLLVEWLGKNAEALTQLRLGVQMAQDANPFKDDIGLPTDLGVESDKFPKLIRMAVFRAKLTAAERGLTTEAEEDLLMCHRLGCELAQSASVVEHLVGVGVQTWTADVVFNTLARMPVDTATMTRLQTCLERPAVAGDDPTADIIRGQKLSFLPVLRKAFEGTNPESKLKHDEAVFLAVELDLTWEQMDALDLRYGRTIRDFDAAYAYCHRFLSLSPLEARAEGLDFWKDLDELKRENPFVRLLMFNGPGVARVRAHCEATQDALTTTLALLRYKREKGTFPDTLQELVSASFVSRLPMDPYSGKSLVYKRTDVEFVLYSLAEDFDDDGGWHSDWGQRKEGGDHVFWPVQALMAEK